jgi:hypothetical protein
MLFPDTSDYFCGGYCETHRRILGLIDCSSYAHRIRRREAGALGPS